MASIAQLNANRENSKRSTGPKSKEGKAAVSTNALRTGLRSHRLLVEGENPEEYLTLCSHLNQTLRPEGAVEIALAERIAVAIWRQRRLLDAEAATITLERRPVVIARAAERLNEPGLNANIASDDLAPFDEVQAEWCRSVLNEVDGLTEIRLDTLKERAPLIHAQLLSDAAEDDEDPETHVSNLKHGLTTYVGELALWCQQQLRAAEMRPRLLDLAEQLKMKGLVLPVHQLEILARYQTMIDNQFYKALRAFREAQEWRMKSLDCVAAEQPNNASKTA